MQTAAAPSLKNTRRSVLHHLRHFLPLDRQWPKRLPIALAGALIILLAPPAGAHAATMIPGQITTWSTGAATSGLAVGPNGSVYVSEFSGNILVYNAAGTLTQTIQSPVTISAGVAVPQTVSSVRPPLDPRSLARTTT